jgi:hypothetical protein
MAKIIETMQLLLKSTNPELVLILRKYHSTSLSETIHGTEWALRDRDIGEYAILSCSEYFVCITHFCRLSCSLPCWFRHRGYRVLQEW